MGDRVSKSPNYPCSTLERGLIQNQNEKNIRTNTQRNVGIKTQNSYRRKR